MATATLAVSVKARTANFERGMKRASRAVSKLRARLASAASSALRFGLGLITLGGIAGFGLVIKNAFKTTDALAKMSTTLGANIANLDALHFAARRFGATTDDVDKSLIRFARAISEVATTGAGEALLTFEALGLSAKDLATKLPFDQIKAFIVSLTTLSTQVEKVDAIAELFGKRGVKLTPLFLAATGTLDKMRDAFRMLGPSITEEGAEKVTDANDAFEDFGTSVSILTRGIAVGLGQSIKDLGNILTGFSSDQDTANLSIGESIAAWSKWAFEVGVAVTVFGVVAKTIFTVVTAVKALTIAIAAGQAFAGPLGIASLVGGALAAQFAVDEIDDIFKKIEEARVRGAGIQDVSNSAKGGGEVVDLLRQQLAQATEMNRKMFSGFAVVR